MRKQLAEIRKVQNMTAYWLIHVLCTALVLKKSEAHYLFISVGSHCSLLNSHCTGPFCVHTHVIRFLSEFADPTAICKLIWRGR